jgi:hypothetical protein
VVALFRVAYGADESLRTRWCPGVGWAHAVVLSVPARAGIVIAARRLAGSADHVVAVAGVVHLEDLWQLCRAELTGVNIGTDGWDIRCRWFGFVVGATRRTGKLSCG